MTGWAIDPQECGRRGGQIDDVEVGKGRPGPDPRSHAAKPIFISSRVWSQELVNVGGAVIPSDHEDRFL